MQIACSCTHSRIARSWLAAYRVSISVRIIHQHGSLYILFGRQINFAHQLLFACRGIFTVCKFSSHRRRACSVHMLLYPLLKTYFLLWLINLDIYNIQNHSHTLRANKMANMLGMVYLCKLANWIPLGKIPIYANDTWTAYSDMAAQVIVESNCSWATAAAFGQVRCW